MTWIMVLQLFIVLGALWVGSRYGSLALGAISGIGLAILVFAFGMKPGTPPTDVIYIIIAAVTCAGIMQASGGMDWLIQASMPSRIARVMKEQNMSEDEARKTIEKVDKMRENYVREFTGTSRYDTRNYQLVLCMDGMTEDAAVRIIMEYIKSTN